jgi:FkbM family methyltransferase
LRVDGFSKRGRDEAMIGRFKDYVRRTPRLFDRLRVMQRRLSLRIDRTYEFLNEFSRARNGKITFVQIGANDGLRNDPIREFVIRDGWRGVFVEPIPDVFELLRRNYAYAKNPSLTFVNAAVSSVSGQRQAFYTFDELFLLTLPLERRLELLRKASFDRQHLLRYSDDASAQAIREVEVPCFTVADLVETHLGGQAIDLLAIDAEGHEPMIIGSLDFSAVRPQVIFFESHNLGSHRDPLFGLLTDHGYELLRLGPDTAAVRKNALA